MLERNEKAVLDCIAPDDIVLDIGGWARPFNRANYVLDAEPYETRGYYGPSRPPQGGAIERFQANTWIQRDICSRDPFPFGDKQIDFCICSHTLEDVRDPLWVCSEMIRVAKRGYIEVPSRVAECCRGWEHTGIAGLSHHRWFVDIGTGSIQFLMKFHMVHADHRFSLPPRVYRKLSEEEKVQWLFWEREFSYGERTIHGLDQIALELRRFVEKQPDRISFRDRLGDLRALRPAWASTAAARLKGLRA